MQPHELRASGQQLEEQYQRGRQWLRQDLLRWQEFEQTTRRELEEEEKRRMIEVTCQQAVLGEKVKELRAGAAAELQTLRQEWKKRAESEGAKRTAPREAEEQRAMEVMHRQAGSDEKENEAAALAQEEEEMLQAIRLDILRRIGITWENVEPGGRVGSEGECDGAAYGVGGVRIGAPTPGSSRAVGNGCEEKDEKEIEVKDVDCRAADDGGTHEKEEVDASAADGEQQKEQTKMGAADVSAVEEKQLKAQDRRQAADAGAAKVTRRKGQAKIEAAAESASEKERGVEQHEAESEALRKELAMTEELMMREAARATGSSKAGGCCGCIARRGFPNGSGAFEAVGVEKGDAVGVDRGAGRREEERQRLRREARARRTGGADGDGVGDEASGDAGVGGASDAQSNLAADAIDAESDRGSNNTGGGAAEKQVEKRLAWEVAAARPAEDEVARGRRGRSVEDTGGGDAAVRNDEQWQLERQRWQQRRKDGEGGERCEAMMVDLSEELGQLESYSNPKGDSDCGCSSGNNGSESGSWESDRSSYCSADDGSTSGSCEMYSHSGSSAEDRGGADGSLEGCGDLEEVDVQVDSKVDMSEDMAHQWVAVVLRAEAQHRQGQAQRRKQQWLQKYRRRLLQKRRRRRRVRGRNAQPGQRNRAIGTAGQLRKCGGPESAAGGCWGAREGSQWAAAQLGSGFRSGWVQVGRGLALGSGSFGLRCFG